jgi:hypothetical protein
VSRDPIGYRGGASLYAYSGGVPVNGTDPQGLAYQPCPPKCPKNKRRSPGTCCNDAKNGGMAAGSAAGVVCCDGRKVSCAWLPDGGVPGNSASNGIISDCLLDHEKDHWSDIPACSPQCGTLSRPPFRPGAEPAAEECNAYRVELDCLTRSRVRCNGNPTCEQAVDIRTNFVSKQILSYCQ